jgi:hypothetical protein
MTQVSVGPRGLWYAPWRGYCAQQNFSAMDAADEKISSIGTILFEGGPGAAKTLSVGTIEFLCGTITLASGTTALDIGIQDIDATTSSPIRPDNSFDVKTTVTAASPQGVVTAGKATATMSIGSKTIAHGDRVAIVMHMTARGGADSVQVVGFNNSQMFGSNNGLYMDPFTSVDINGGGWVQGAVGSGMFVITFDDGTRGYLANSVVFQSANSESSYAVGNNPNERGMILQVPWDCKISGLIFGPEFGNATTSDGLLSIYADPLGTPVSLGSFTIDVEKFNANTFDFHALRALYFASEISLSRNTDYWIALKATGAGNLSNQQITLFSENHRGILPFGTTFKKATRFNGGAMTVENPAVTIYGMGVIISSFDDGSSPASVTLLGQSVM